MGNSFQKVAAHGFIKKDGKYLVTHRIPNDDHSPNMWDIPGGSTDFGEDPKDAAKREIFEETRLDVAVGNLIYCHSHVGKNNGQYFQLVYECEYISGEVVLNPEEHDEYRWVSVAEMHNLDKIAFLDHLYKDILVK